MKATLLRHAQAKIIRHDPLRCTLRECTHEDTILDDERSYIEVECEHGRHRFPLIDMPQWPLIAASRFWGMSGCYCAGALVADLVEKTK